MNLKTKRYYPLFRRYLSLLLIIFLVIVINLIIHSINTVTIDTSDSASTLTVSKKYIEYFDIINFISLTVIISCFIITMALTTRDYIRLEKRAYTFSQYFSDNSLTEINQALAQNLEEGNIISSWNQSIREISKIHDDREKYLKSMVHDFKMPIQLLKLNIDLYKIEYGDNEYIDLINEQVGDFNYNVMKILYLDRIKYFDKPQIRKCDVNGLLFDFVKTYKIKNDVVIETNSPLIIKSDCDMLNKIFQNLIENAIKYKSSGDVKVVVNPNYILFENNIDTKIELDDIFNCQRVVKPHGTGLGLMIIKQYSEMLGLNINLACEDNLFKAYISIPEQIIVG